MRDAPQTTEPTAIGGAPPGLDGSRGRYAETPRQIPWAGIGDVLWRVWREAIDDKISMVAGSVAFFGMVAVFPTLIAVVSLYGLVFDPHDVLRQVRELSPALPAGARRVLLEQLSEIVQSPRTTLGFGLATSLLATIATASSGMHALIDGINHAYDEKETRTWFQVRLLALRFTVGAVLFVVASLALIAVVPPLLKGLWASSLWLRAIGILRWPALGIALALGLASLYRYAPNRRPPRWQWVSWGAAVATLLWLAISYGFSLYVQSFGRFNQTYGTLGGVIVLLFWMFLSSFAILIGAELNAELEHQTAVDSTVGPARPMGERRAFVADTLGDQRPPSLRPGTTKLASE